MIVNTDELLKELEKIHPEGFEVTFKNGILKSTKAIYLKHDEIYLFHMNDEFILEKGTGYLKSEFIEKYKGLYWLTDMVIG